MAEVSGRLGTGAYRLSALRNTQSRSVRSRESHGALRANSSVTAGRACGEAGGEPAPAPGDCQPAAESRAAKPRAEKLCRQRKRRADNGSLPCGTSWDLDVCPPVRLAQHRGGMQAHRTPLSQPPDPQVDLPLARTTCRSATGVFLVATIHPDTFRSPQQLRHFCTVILTLAERGSELPGAGLSLKRLRLRPEAPQPRAAARCYSWRGNNSAKDSGPLYRSRTAYYDILNVSPSATQAQIKTAYYKQSFIYHPDKNPGSEEATQRFSEISEAYTVLGNISLRRKYDRGILSQSDIQGAGRPSSREAASRAPASQQQQQQQHHRTRRYSQAGGRPMFDFDAFYQAHYGEQLQRERELRARKQRLQEQQKKEYAKWRLGKMLEVTAGMLLAVAGVIFLNLSRP